MLYRKQDFQILFPRYSYLVLYVISNAGLWLFHLLLPTATNLHFRFRLVFPTSLAVFKLDSPELAFFGVAQFFLWSQFSSAAWSWQLKRYPGAWLDWRLLSFLRSTWTIWLTSVSCDRALTKWTYSYHTLQTSMSLKALSARTAALCLFTSTEKSQTNCIYIPLTKH